MSTLTELERGRNNTIETLVVEAWKEIKSVNTVVAEIEVYAQTVAEKAVREERERLIDYVQHYPDCPISENTGSRLNADYKLEFMYNNKWHGIADLPPCNCGLTEALTPLPDKE